MKHQHQNRIPIRLCLLALSVSLLVPALTGCGKPAEESATPPVSSAQSGESGESGGTLTAGDGTVSDGTVSDFAQALYDAKIAATDDTILDSELFTLLDIPAVMGDAGGGCTIELDTSLTPYAVNMMFAEQPASTATAQNYAVLLLALIDDATEVQWSYPMDSTGSAIMSAHCNIENADYILGVDDVKTLAQTPEGVQQVLDTLGISG